MHRCTIHVDFTDTRESFIRKYTLLQQQGRRLLMVHGCIGRWFHQYTESRALSSMESSAKKARDYLCRVPLPPCPPCPSRGLMDGAPQHLHPAVTRRGKMIMQEAWQKRGIRVEGTNSLRAGWVKWPWSNVRLSRGIAQTHLVSIMWRRLKGGCDISRTSMGCGLIPSDEVTISSSSENI